MNRVVWGMPTIEEMENPKPMTEYAGCIIGPDTPKWHCEVCGSSVIPTLHPKSGICLQEARVEVRQAIEMLAMRIEQFAGDFEPGESPIEIFCPRFLPTRPIHFSQTPCEQSMSTLELRIDA